MIDKLMKDCAELGLKIDPNPDYPLQLNYFNGKFLAQYEPNYDSVISAEGNSAEEALIRLTQLMQAHIYSSM